MRLAALRLTNFRQHASTAITFESGLTGIIGPNGSGKTTLLEAIAWALYGNSAARGDRESIKFNRAPARAPVRVELEFELGGHRYRVVRSRTSAELYMDGGDSTIAQTTTGVTEFLQRRLGMTRVEFFNTYFTGQKELNGMSAMKPAERAQFVSRVLGYEKLRTAQQLVRERRSSLKAEGKGLQSALADRGTIQRALDSARARFEAAEQRARDAEARRDEAGALLTELGPRWRDAQQQRDRLQEIVAEERVLDQELSGHERDRERLVRELHETEQAAERLARTHLELEPLASLRAELRQFESLLREEGRRKALADSGAALADELARLEERRARVSTAPALEPQLAAELEARRQEFDVAQAALEARRTLWVQDRQEAETKLKELRERWAEFRGQRDRVVAAGDAGACPICARPLHESYQSVLELLDEQIQTAAVDGKYFKARSEQLAEVPPEVRELEERRARVQQDATALERRLAKVQSAVMELSQLDRDVVAKRERGEAIRADLAALPQGYDVARHTAVRQTVERLAPLEALVGRLGAQAERRELLAAERERGERSLTGARDRRAAVAQRRAELAFSETDFAALRTAYERGAADVRAAETGLIAAHGETATSRVGLDAVEAEERRRAADQGRLDELVREERLHDELDRAYTELREDLNVALRPELEELASAFLSELTDSRYSQLELDEQYNVLVLEDGLPKPVISGGEEDIANLVLRLAISQMIAERAGQPFSLLILDEIFGSLDDARRQNVVALLRTLHDRFEQVVLITHIESVREELDNVILVRFDEETGASSAAQFAGGTDEANDESTDVAIVGSINAIRGVA